MDQRQLDELAGLVNSLRGIVACASSVGDAIAAMEKKFPGWPWVINNYDGMYCALTEPNDGRTFSASADTIQEAIFGAMDKAFPHL